MMTCIFSFSCHIFLKSSSWDEKVNTIVNCKMRNFMTNVLKFSSSKIMFLILF